ncbi:DJ-1/PfpI family protein [Phlyctema vagabunda]|uniref:DJ-1/PfpI family protein n=1 Tax=Phlyctema vagabunda TaxID=108571 RepID=A0ABR4P984_9HELO
MTSIKPINFGILTIPYQTTDVAGPIDILSNVSQAFIADLEKIGAAAPGASKNGIPITFHHIGETLDAVSLTGAFKVLPTTTCDDCPPLDCLLVGGADPNSYQLGERFTTFVQQHVAARKLLFMTCTGALCISSSGILDGKNATTNHMCIELAKMARPTVKWTKEAQWVVDGNLWSSGGACAGMDMMAYWVKKTYGEDVVQYAYETLDFEPRDVHGKRVLAAEK